MAYYQKNMLSIKSRILLANILAEVVLISQSLEVYRQALANIEHFDCMSLFRYLDREEKGYLRQKDFQRAIGTSHRKLLTYAFSWFDNMKIGEISRLQFAAFLLPKQNLKLRELVAKRVQNPQSIEFQNESIMLQFDLFSKMVVQIMNREMRIIELRRELVKSQDYSIRGVLLAIDSHKHDWLSSDDLFQFLKNYGFDIDLRQIQKLVEIINHTFDGKITEEQLRWTVEGFETKNKNYLEKIKNSNKKQVSRMSSLQKDYFDNTIKSPQVRQFTEDESPPDSQLKIRFKKLLDAYHATDQQQKKIDQLLQLQAKQIDIQFDKQCQIYIAQLRQRKEHQYNLEMKAKIAYQEELRLKKLKAIQEETYLLQKQKDYEIYLKDKEEILRKEKELQRLQEQNLRTAYIKDLAQKSLGYSSTYYGNLSPALQFTYNNYKTMYSPHSPKKEQSPFKRKDYTDLSRLSKLTQVESFRKPTQRSNYNIQNFNEKSPILEQSNSIRDMIKKQREIQKQIQSRFTTGKFDASKYSSRNSSMYVSNKFHQTPNQTPKCQAPGEFSPKFKDTGI